MKRIKPVYITALTIIIFAIGMFLGVKSDWWILEGRKTPLDNEKSTGHSEEEHMDDEHSEGENIHEEHSDEEEHEEKTEITGSSTVQNALDLGITKQQLEDVLENAVGNPEEKIKDIATARGLSFGKVKEELNSLIGK